MQEGLAVGANADATLHGVSYNVAISACGQGEQWEQALPLLRKKQEAGVTLNAISYNVQPLATLSNP